MEWLKVEGKLNPHYCTQLLCAWKPSTRRQDWRYEVLTHCADGTWTDNSDDEVPADEMPDYWMAISSPVDALANRKFNY